MDKRQCGDDTSGNVKIQEVPSHKADKSVIINVSDLRYGFNLLNPLEGHPTGPRKFQDVHMNEFEKKITSEIVEPSEIGGVNWEDIGAHEEVKQILKDVVILPLRRPEFFRKGILSKSCKGILLFGPPGTGLFIFLVYSIPLFILFILFSLFFIFCKK